MVIEDENQSGDWSQALISIFKEIQADTILLAAVGLMIAGVVFLGLIPTFSNTNYVVVTGICLLIIGVISLLLRRFWYVGSVSLITLASLGTIFILMIPLQVEPSVILLFLPVGIFSLMINPIGGVILAGVLTLLIIVNPGEYITIQSNLKILSITAIWLVVGLIYLAIRPLITTVRYVWDSFEKNQEILETSRENQYKLNQTLQDLTEANIQLNRFTQMAQSLRQIAEDERKAKEVFVANVSHELRTPLNMITGFCEMILQSPETYGKRIPATLLADLGVVLRNSQHLSNLIDDVLDLSQIDAGRMALVKEKVDFNEIVTMATTAVRPLYESKGLYLKTQIQEEIPPVYCDRTRIREVLLNLLSNAGRFTEHGGVIVTVTLDRQNLLVSVQDTGPGISDIDQEKLFRPFQQLDASLNRRKGGTGLGLSISKSFVELHEGKMWVESKKDEGTTFYFRLPLQPQGPKEAGATRWINPYAHIENKVRRPDLNTIIPKPRIMVIEKGFVIDRLLGRYLDGVDIIHQDNLQTALDSIGQDPVQAILINDMNPGDILVELTNCGKLPETIPALVVSVPSLDRATGFPGVADYLVKPIAKNTLIERIAVLEKTVNHILIVDDEEDAQILFRRMLLSNNKEYKIFRATNGKQALEILQREKIDLILLDLMMPEMNGFEFLTEKNQHPEWKNIPVFLISARDPQGNPIVTQSLAITRGGGISTQQLLMSLEAFINILSPFHTLPGQELKGKPDEKPAFE